MCMRGSQAQPCVFNTFCQGVCNDGGSHVKTSSIYVVPLGIVQTSGVIIYFGDAVTGIRRKKNTLKSTSLCHLCLLTYYRIANYDIEYIFQFRQISQLTRGVLSCYGGNFPLTSELVLGMTRKFTNVNALLSFGHRQGLDSFLKRCISLTKKESFAF